MAVSSRSSGDLLADRRFAYAESLLRDGDIAAAADLLDQTLALVPAWVPAWLALAAACERQGDPAGAERACSRAAALDVTGLYGASLHLARCRGGAVLPAMPEAYVAALFDDYAARFDRHLVDGLGYRGPALILEALAKVAPGRRFGACIDLGCGTGLMGAAIRSAVDQLTGVDLSAAMLAEAGRRGLYDDLGVGEIHRFLDGRAAGSCDLILAADVFAYIGPIDRTFAAAARVLRQNGLLAFTVQRGGTGAASLGADMRFSHPPAVVEATITAAGLHRMLLSDASTRRDAGIDVPGLVVVARKP